MGLNRIIKKINEAIDSTNANICDLFDVICDLFSIKVLKPYFGVETRRYLEWHDRRARRIQMRLDWEHSTRIAELYWKPDYE